MSILLELKLVIKKLDSPDYNPQLTPSLDTINRHNRQAQPVMMQ